MKKTVKAAPKKARTLGKGNKFDDIDGVIQCARVCFSRFGVEKTRLEDIAAAAGVSRPLLYKLFDGRQGLVDVVINVELQQVTAEQRQRMQQQSSFRGVLIEGMVAGVELAQQDSLLMDLLLHSSVEHLPDLLLAPENPAHANTLGLWKPFFDQAREQGELSPSLSDDDLMEWLMSIQYAFLMREQVSAERITELLDTFLIPALTPRP